MRAPATTRITLGYLAYGEAGYTKENPHVGVDFSFQPDDQIYAPEAGTVTFVGLMGTAGQTVELTNGSHKHRLCHMQSYNVALGQQVEEGHVLGIMGETGSAVGRHLHWVMFINGVRVNGLDYVTEGGAEVIQDNDSEFNRWGKLHRRIRGSWPTRQQFKDSFVGKNPEAMIDEIQDNPEADYREHAADVGNLAIQGDWWNRLLEKSESDVSSEDIDNAIEEANQALAAVTKLKK